MKRIVLASASPRRAQLLTQVGLPFEVIVSDAHEEMLDLPPGDFVKSTAFQKAKIISKQIKEGIIIAADTIVAFDDKILGKPSDEKEAFEILTALSAQKHEVFTGLCVIDMPSSHYILDYCKTEVYFQKLSSDDIKAYIATGEPFDKAGAYGIQGKGALLVEKINGCYFNVVGLPLSLLKKYLIQFNINLLGKGETSENGVSSY